MCSLNLLKTYGHLEDIDCPSYLSLDKLADIVEDIHNRRDALHLSPDEVNQQILRVLKQIQDKRRYVEERAWYVEHILPKVKTAMPSQPPKQCSFEALFDFALELWIQNNRKLFDYFDEAGELTTLAEMKVSEAVKVSRSWTAVTTSDLCGYLREMQSHISDMYTKVAKTPSKANKANKANNEKRGEDISTDNDHNREKKTVVKAFHLPPPSAVDGEQTSTVDFDRKPPATIAITTTTTTNSNMYATGDVDDGVNEHISRLESSHNRIVEQHKSLLRFNPMVTKDQLLDKYWQTVQGKTIKGKYKVVEDFHYVSSKEDVDSLLVFDEDKDVLRSSPSFLNKLAALPNAGNVHNVVGKAVEILANYEKNKSLSIITYPENVEKLDAVQGFLIEKKDLPVTACLQDTTKMPVFFPSKGRVDAVESILRKLKNHKDFLCIFVIEADEYLSKYFEAIFSSTFADIRVAIFVLPKVHAGIGYSRYAIQKFAKDSLPAQEWIFMVDDSVGDVYVPGRASESQLPLLAALRLLKSRTEAFIATSGVECTPAAVGTIKSRMSNNGSCVDLYFPEFCYPSSLMLINMRVCVQQELYFDIRHRVAEDMCFALQCIRKGVLVLVDKFFAHTKKQFGSGGACEDKVIPKDCDFKCTDASTTNIMTLSFTEAMANPLNMNTSNPYVFPIEMTTTSRKQWMVANNRLITVYTNSSNDFCINASAGLMDAAVGFGYYRGRHRVWLTHDQHNSQEGHSLEYTDFTSLEETHSLVSVNGIDQHCALVISNASQPSQRMVDIRCSAGFSISTDIKFKGNDVKRDAAYEDSLMLNDKQYLVLGQTGQVKLFDLRKCKPVLDTFEKVKEACNKDGAKVCKPLFHTIYDTKVNPEQWLVMTYQLRDKIHFGAVLMNISGTQLIDRGFSFDHRPVPVLDGKGNISLMSAPTQLPSSKELFAQTNSPVTVWSSTELDTYSKPQRVRTGLSDGAIRWSMFDNHSFVTLHDQDNTTKTANAFKNLSFSFST